MDLTLGPGEPPPFWQLAGSAFEELCRDLLAAQPDATAELYGRSGKDRGIDIIVRSQNGATAVQCKAHKRFTAAKIRAASDVFLRHLGHWKDHGVVRFVLIVGNRLDNQKQQDAIAKEAQRLEAAGLGYDVWSASSLEARLRTHPTIVEQYCQPPDAWRERICGRSGRGSSAPFINVPDPSQHFAGRDEDLDAVRSLLSRGNTAVSASIGGLAGIGKTELAIHVARGLADEGTFPGGVFWLDAERPDLTPTWGTTIADALAVPEGPVAERAQQVLLDLGRRKERLLVVLDNVVEWAGDDRPQPLPEGTHITRLVTSRRRDLGHGLRTYDLDVLSREASRELLTELAQRDLQAESGFDELVEYLDGHALALELAGAYLREYPNVSPAAYRERLRADPAAEESVSAQSRYQATVHQALRTTWDALDEPARRAWLLAACFEPEPATVALADACGLDGEARRALRRFYLINDQSGASWRMHRLTREFGQRINLQGERSQALRAFVDGCRRRVRLDDEEILLCVYKQDRRHIEAAAQQAEAIGVSHEDRAVFADDIAGALHTMGNLPAAAQHYEHALQLDLESLGEDHSNIAGRRSDLAMVLKDLGERSRAQELLERALESAVRLPGCEHPSVATFRSNLAMVLKDAGELPRARELLEEALASDLKNLGESHPEVAVARSNLALVLRGLGEPVRARALLERALESDLMVHGDDHPSVALHRSNLGAVLTDLGELPLARKLFEQALAAELKIYGEDHPNVARRRSNLATVLKRPSELPRAKELLELALTWELKNLGTHHPSVVASHSNLGAVLRDMGDSAGAREQLQHALAAALKSLGVGHATVAQIHYNLACVAEQEGDLTDALQHVREAARIQTAALGASHPASALVRARLAALLARAGHPAAAHREAQAAIRAVANAPRESFFRRSVEDLTKSLT